MHRVPRFSIIVPAFNAQTTIAETLSSIVAQEYSDWECVVVDDGSEDTTADVTGVYIDRDRRFRLVRQANQGVAGAYRTGTMHARADLFVVCASDDLLLPRHLRVMDGLIHRHPGCSIFSCNGEYLDERSGSRTVVYSDEEWRVERSLTLEQVLENCFFGVGAVVAREAIEATGGYRSGVYSEDFDLWLRAMASGFSHCYTPEVLTVHRISPRQHSADLVRVWESNIEVYRNLLATYELERQVRERLQTVILRDAIRIADYSAARVLTPDELERMRAQYSAYFRSLTEAASMGAQGERLKALGTRLLGPRLAEVVVALIRPLVVLARPIRRMIARSSR